MNTGLALLHRRLTTGAALAALLTFAAGEGFDSPYVLVPAAVLVLALVWRPSSEAGARIEIVSRIVSLALFAWIFYEAFVVAGDFMPPVLALMLFLLASESLRPLQARNDLRLYGLSLALLIASTAYRAGVWFGVGFVAYIVLATLALMVGHLRRQAETFRIADIPIRRPFLTATAALSGVTVLMSAVVFITFPRFPRNWTGLRLNNTGAVMAGFGDEVSLGEFGTRIGSNPEVVLRVEFPDGPPRDVGSLHWRGRSYDFFDGVRWSRTRRVNAIVPPEIYLERWGAPIRRQRIYGGPEGAAVLFGLHPILDLDPRSRIRPFLDRVGDVRYWGSDIPVYTVTSGPTLPPPAALRAAPDGPPPAGGAYLQLPRMSPRIALLADSLTRDYSTRYDKGLALVRFFERNFLYTLDLPPRRSEASLEYFLFERRAGHCEYFSTAMVVMLRSIGIPARNVNGFLGGAWNPEGRYLAVSQNDAHSWVEAWFPELGWVPFDPTPSGTREAVIDRQGGVGRDAFWPGRLFFDGLQHRWNKWVLDYNLEKQIGMLQKVGDLFDRNESRGPRGGFGNWREALPWLAVVAALFLTWRLIPRRKRRTLSPEGRIYLALRQSYARAGFEDRAAPPLEWMEMLRKNGAPGITPAERIVRSYLRARFGGEQINDAEMERMRADLAEVRRAIRPARKAA